MLVKKILVWILTVFILSSSCTWTMTRRQ